MENGHCKFKLAAYLYVVDTLGCDFFDLCACDTGGLQRLQRLQQRVQLVHGGHC